MIISIDGMSAAGKSTLALELAKKLEIQLIAEGVETENHFEFLKKAGCKYFQGFYLEKPIDLSLFEKKYIN